MSAGSFETHCQAGWVPVADVNKHLLNLFRRGWWDNLFISELQLKQKKANPSSFAELLLLLCTEEDRDAAKSLSMTQHLGATRPKAASHQQVVYSNEKKKRSLC